MYRGHEVIGHLQCQSSLSLLMETRSLFYLLLHTPGYLGCKLLVVLRPPPASSPQMCRDYKQALLRPALYRFWVSKPRSLRFHTMACIFSHLPRPCENWFVKQVDSISQISCGRSRFVAPEPTWSLEDWQGLNTVLHWGHGTQTALLHLFLCQPQSKPRTAGTKWNPLCICFSFPLPPTTRYTPVLQNGSVMTFTKTVKNF